MSKVQATPCTKLLTSVRTKTTTQKPSTQEGRRGNSREQEGDTCSAAIGMVTWGHAQCRSRLRRDTRNQATPRTQNLLAQERGSRYYYCSNSSKVELELATVLPYWNFRPKRQVDGSSSKTIVFGNTILAVWNLASCSRHEKLGFVEASFQRNWGGPLLGVQKASAQDPEMRLLQ